MLPRLGRASRDLSSMLCPTEVWLLLPGHQPRSAGRTQNPGYQTRLGKSRYRTASRLPLNPGGARPSGRCFQQFSLDSVGFCDHDRICAVSWFWVSPHRVGPGENSTMPQTPAQVAAIAQARILGRSVVRTATRHRASGGSHSSSPPAARGDAGPACRRG